MAPQNNYYMKTGLQLNLGKLCILNNTSQLVVNIQNNYSVLLLPPFQQPHSNTLHKNIFVHRYTKSGSNGVANTVVYATVLNWPKYGHLKLAAPQLVKESTVTLLGYTQDLQVHK